MEPLALTYLSPVRGEKIARETHVVRLIFENQQNVTRCLDPEVRDEQRLGMWIDEIPVVWKEIDGSKLRVKSVVRIASHLVRLDASHRTGIWTVRTRGALTVSGELQCDLR
jgi:hypothetical protein